MQEIQNVKVTEFAKRHFSETFSGTRINWDIERFEELINHTVNSYDYNSSIKIGHVTNIKDGYAPFCKEICIENFTGAKTGVAEITMENHHYLRSRYSGRRDSELPILTRSLHYPERRFIPKANYLILILYSREQCLAEHEAIIDECPILPFEFEGDNTEWGIVNIMAQLSQEADPINPTTMMRNHLGKKFGGSGIKIDPEKYNESVEFWSKHAIVK